MTVIFYNLPAFGFVFRGEIQQIKINIMKFVNPVGKAGRAGIENFRKPIFAPHRERNSFAVGNRLFPPALRAGHAVFYGAVAREHQRCAPVNTNPARQIAAEPVDLVDGQPTKWKVENSWGDKVGEKGFFVMSDDWMEEFCYQIVVNKKYLPKDLQEILKEEPTMLAPWDPMGALA